MSSDVQRKCAECHKELKDNQGHPESVSIPATSSFHMPSGGVLLYCDECYEKREKDAEEVKRLLKDEETTATLSERKMFKVICAECKQECEVPFEPKYEKPVYCRDCYLKRRKI